MRRSPSARSRVSSGLLLLPLTVVVVGCGDDSISATGEDTDSSESSSTDGPSTIDPSATLDPDTTVGDPTMPDACGNGNIDGDEDCDGERLGGGRCENQGFAAGTLACNDDCTYDVSGCSDNACGDASIDEGEECDGELLIGQECDDVGFDEGTLSCNDDCTLNTSECIMYSCGNEELEGREVCDGTVLGGADCISEGFVGGELACSKNCDSLDTAGCFLSICGNAVAEDLEPCDGADLTGNDCVSIGLGGGDLVCADDCTFDTTACYFCGDGEVNPGEECEGDAGTTTCTDLGFDGGEIGCESNCRFDTSACFVCGDGQIGGEEICDGNDFGANTCVALGFDGGRPRCADDCGSFTSESCFGLHSFCATPAAAIGPGAGVLTQSDIQVAGLVGAVVDIDVVVEATHTAVGNLAIDVTHLGSAASVSLADSQCGAGDNIDATFDQDAAAAPDCVAPIVIQGDVLPQGDLDAMGALVEEGNGTWRLSVLDQTAGDGGTLTQWCVELTTEAGAESFAYVVNDDFQNSVTGYAIGDDGSLTELEGSPYFTDGDSNFDYHANAMVSCGDFMYVANWSSSSITAFSVGDDGALASIAGSPFFSPSAYGLACDSGILFVTDYGNLITRFQIAGDGSLTELGSTESNFFTAGVSVDPVSNRLFVSNHNTQLSVFDIDDGGDLTAVPGTPVDTFGNHFSAVLSPDGSLVALEGFNAVHLFGVQDDGSVTEVAGSPFEDPAGCDTVGLAWSPDGTRLFAGHRFCFPSLVTAYDVVGTSLEVIAGSPFETGSFGAVGLAVSSDGARLFVSHQDPGTGVLDIGPDGSLTPVPGSPFPNTQFGSHPMVVLR